MDPFDFEDESPNLFIKLRQKKTKNPTINHINLIDKRFSFNKMKTKSKQDNKSSYQIFSSYFNVPRKDNIKDNFNVISPHLNRKSMELVKYPDRNISIKYYRLMSPPLNNIKISSEIKIFNKTAKIIKNKPKNFIDNNYMTNDIKLPEILKIKNNLSEEHINIKFITSEDNYLSNTNTNYTDSNNNIDEKVIDTTSKKFKLVEMKIHNIRNKNNNNIFQKNLMKNLCYRIRKNNNLEGIKKDLKKKLGQKICNSFLNETINLKTKNKFTSSFIHLNKDVINNNNKIQRGKSCFNLLLNKQNVYKSNSGLDYFKTNLEKEIQDAGKNKNTIHFFNIPREKKIGYRLKCMKADLKFFDIN